MHVRQRLLALIGIWLTVSLFIWLAQTGGVLQEIENRAWDWRLQFSTKRQQVDGQVKVIVIDQSSLDYFATQEKIYWPWPRALYEPVLKFLNHGGARAVAFDILFTEPSSYGVEDDAVLAAAVSEGAPVVSAVALRSSQPLVEPNVRAQKLISKQVPASLAIPNLFPLGKHVQLYEAITTPIDELVEHSAAFGNVSALPDSDGIFRHARPWAQFAGVPFLTLPFAVYNLSSPNPEALQWFTDRVDTEGKLAVQFRGPARTFPTFGIASIIASYQQILEGKQPQVDPALFGGNFVFVGMDAPGLLDLRPTPLSEAFPGVEYNATVLDNILRQDFVKKWTPTENFLFTSLISLLVVSASLLLRQIPVQIVAIAAIMGGLLLFSLQMAFAGVWIATVLPLSAAALSAFAAVAFQYQMEGRQHRFIRDAFRFYVSPAVIDKIVQDPSSLSLGGERRELTILFSDIVGFTNISEKMDPQRLVQLLNTFLSAMTEIILKHGGTVDKYVGDAIVAFWNAPLVVEDHAARALRAAVECQRELGRLGKHFQDEYSVQIRMRVGLHTGVVGVGNFGSRERFNYTVIGDAANLASRLEGANKFFGTSILISGSTNTAQNGFIPTRKIADIRVVGKSEAIAVFEPLFDAGFGVLSKEQIAAYSQALAAFELGQLETSLEHFSQLGHDPVSRVYLSRINRDIARRDGNKGDEKWSAVWNLSEK